MSRLLIAVTVIMLFVVTPVVAETDLACCTEPVYGSAVIDGNPTEWISDPTWGYLRLGWEKEILAEVKIRYDCSTETLFLYVETVGGRTIQDKDEETFVKHESSAFPWIAFEWTDTSHRGFEAAVVWPRTWDTITIHVNVVVDGVAETAGLRGGCVTINCRPTAVTLRDAGVWSDGNGIHIWWWTAMEIGTSHYEVWRTAINDFQKWKVLVATVPTESFGMMDGALYNKTVQKPAQNKDWHYWLVEHDQYGAGEPLHLGVGNWNQEMPWVQSLMIAPGENRKVRLVVTARDRQANMVNIYTMVGDHPSMGALVLYDLRTTRFLLNNLIGGWVGSVLPKERVTLTNPVAKLFGQYGRVISSLEGRRLVVSQTIQIQTGQWPVWVWIEDTTGRASQPALLGLVNIVN